MNNLLDAAADNIFITAAGILDTLTYRFSSTASDISVPNNNDSIIAPLTEQLAKDMSVFDQVLDDYALDLDNCKYILNSMKIKVAKETVLKEKKEIQRQEEERMRLEKEKKEQEQRDREKEQQVVSAKQENASVTSTSAIDQAQGQGNIGQDQGQSRNQHADSDVKATNGSDNNDLIMDLDLDNFNFDSNDLNMNIPDANNMNAPLNMPDTNNMNASMNMPDTSNMNVNMNMNLNSGAPASSEAMDFNINSQLGNSNDNTTSNSVGNADLAGDYMNLDQNGDLDDLNLDFLNDEDEMGNIMQNMEQATRDSSNANANTNNNANGASLNYNTANNSGNGNVGNAGTGAGAGAGSNDDIDDPMAADQMEELFSQFDEMVGDEF
jgi:hypothetical protein